MRGRARDPLLIGMLLATAISGAEGQSVSVGVLGPSSKVAALKDQLGEHYTFIVRFATAEARTAAEADYGFAEQALSLVLIDGVAVDLSVAQAFELANRPGVVQVWYLHPELAPLYIRTIQALEYNVKIGASVANLSIGPQPRFWSGEPDPREPMHAATRAAADAGLVPVIAIGNNPRAAQMPGWINPWCLPEWVICVGAYDVVKQRVAPFSARGAPKQPSTWPDVIADGVDVVGPYPTGKAKSADRKARDEASERFRRSVAAAERHLYTLESGTSQAAAHVTRAAAQVVHFVSEVLRRNGQPKDGEPLFVLTAKGSVPRERLDRPRLTGVATQQPDGSVEYRYVLDARWKLVKQLLLDSALPVPGERGFEAGAGLVDVGHVDRQFGELGLVDVRISASKVLEGP